MLQANEGELQKYCRTRFLSGVHGRADLISLAIEQDAVWTVWT